MTVKSNFLQNNSYNAADLVAEIGALFTDGMLSGGAVTEHSPANLSVDVAALKCLKAGLFLNSDAVENVAIGANTSGYNRIDVIAADLDNQSIVAVQGTPSSSPTAPILTGNKVKLCEILVGNNVSVINTSNITDKRSNVDLFGAQLAAINSSLADKANVAQEAWIAPTLLNSFTNVDTTNQTSAGYMKDTLGFVHLKGYVTGSALITTIFMLPVGYRPSKRLNIPITASNAYSRAAIYPAGDIQVVTGSATNVYLDGITFKAE